MAEIDVTEIGERAFRVEVADGGGSSTHEVTVPDGYPEELELGEVDLAELVRGSFRFLLEREPKESILGSFELPVIERYFPGYPKEIRDRLG